LGSSEDQRPLIQNAQAAPSRCESAQVLQCGFKLANDGVDTRSLQAYLGHRNIQHTVRYSELAPTRFKNFWHD
jgi:site-specific recombinase XerD